MATEVQYFIDEVSGKYGAVYASILAEMCGVDYRADSLSRTAQRQQRARVDGYRQAAVLALWKAEYNEVETREQAEEILKIHRKLFRENKLKDEAERESWV